jgi:hypothetical protein
VEPGSAAKLKLEILSEFQLTYWIDCFHIAASPIHLQNPYGLTQNPTIISTTKIHPSKPHLTAINTIKIKL